MFNYDKLKNRIDELGLQKKALSLSVGRPAHYLNDVIRQHNKIPHDVQVKLADALHVSVEWLNDLPEPEKPPVIATEGVRHEIMARLFAMTDEELLRVLESLREQK